MTLVASVRTTAARSVISSPDNDLRATPIDLPLLINERRMSRNAWMLLTTFTFISSIALGTATAAVTMVRVSQESSPLANDQGQHILGVIKPWQSSLSAAQFYSYGTPIGSSFNGTNISLVDGRSHVFFVQCSAPDNLTIFIVHDRPGFGGNSQAKTALDIIPNSATLSNVPIVRDDPTDSVCFFNAPTHRLTWQKMDWTTCCTGGFAYNGIDFPAWQEAQLVFVQAPSACFGGDTTSPVAAGLNSWFAYSADGTSTKLVLAEGRRTFFNPVGPCEAVAWPSSPTACVGESVTIYAAMPGPDPTQFQWRRNGQPFGSPTTNGILVINNVSTTESGTYDCLITGSCGTVTSSSINLSVLAVGTGDGNNDGTANGLDITLMVHSLIDGESGSMNRCAFDMNNDSVVNMADVAPFIEFLLD